jgi:pyruvate formate lyase activating enzyme
MGCKYCQNWDISKAKFNEAKSIDLPPERVIQMALHYDSKGVAYTYNEPTIFAEYAMDTAKIAHKMNIKNVMVTNGYITPEAVDRVYQNMDAANVDLKAFNENFYRKLTLSHMKPVLQTLKRLKELNVWIEITNLVIPTYNDDTKEITGMCEWILRELGPEVPVHFTAFHPDHRLNDIPSTQPGLLFKIRKLAGEIGLHYIYVGNIGNGEGMNTYCHQCHELLIERSWYNNRLVNMEDGKCLSCQTKIPGIFH